MDTDNNDDLDKTPPEILEKVAKVTLDLLPEISRKKYELAYEKFMEWRRNTKIKSFSESILLVYFEEMSKTLKASTLWSQYSMLRSTISIKNNIDIRTADQLQRFLNEAPDKEYLLIKVAVAIGVAGACRREELWKLKTDNLEDLNSALLVKFIKKK